MNLPGQGEQQGDGVVGHLVGAVGRSVAHRDQLVRCRPHIHAIIAYRQGQDDLAVLQRPDDVGIQGSGNQYHRDSVFHLSFQHIVTLVIDTDQLAPDILEPLLEVLEIRELHEQTMPRKNYLLHPCLPDSF